MKVFTVLIGFLLCNSLATAGTFYKWTDANGNIHYTDKKPEDKKTVEVKVNISQPRTIENNGTDKTDETNHKQSNKKIKTEASTRKKLDKYSKRDKIKKQNARIKRQHCKNAKNSLKKFKESITYRKNDSGSRGYTYPGITRKAKLQAKNQKKIDKYQQNINKSCQ